MSPSSTKQVTASVKRRPPAAGKGRPKGTPNKTTTALKEAILLAGNMAGGRDGLVGYLEGLARKHPVAFSTLLGKVLPMQIANADGTGAFKTENVLRIEFVDAASTVS